MHPVCSKQVGLGEQMRSRIQLSTHKKKEVLSAIASNLIPKPRLHTPILCFIPDTKIPQLLQENDLAVTCQLDLQGVCDLDLHDLQMF